VLRNRRRGSVRIGIFPYLDPNGGGIYQYSLSILKSLENWKTEDELLLVSLWGTQSIPRYLDLRKWEIRSLDLNPPSSRPLDNLRRVIGEGPHRDAWRFLRKKLRQRFSSACVRPELKPAFHELRLDLTLYAWPNTLSFEAGIPFVMAIHDVQHRLHPEYPEVSANGEWESREYCFRNGSRHATLLLADSEIGREDILQCYQAYGVTPDRVKILPFVPACYLNKDDSKIDGERVRERYRLPKRYLFYPAQFWPHKNHLRIIRALKLLRDARDVEVRIVFCGSQTGEIRQHTFRQVIDLCAQLGVEKQVYYLGYVPDKDISAIYGGSAGLVMPSFFGPTNIPVLEAWAHACPVLTSDIRGIREQVGDAGILVDPISVEALADGMYRLWTDETLASSLAQRGLQRLTRYTADDFGQRLIDILEEAKARVRQAQSRRVSI